MKVEIFGIYHNSYQITVTLVPSGIAWTLTMVPCSDAVARYVPSEEKTIAARGDR